VASSHRLAAPWLLGGLVSASVLLAPLSVRAEPGDVALAEALFREGKELLAQKDYARACPKLAESYRRDPATGTLLALAMCHERQGKIASAWGEYSDVASRSKAESRTDREKAARAKALELEPTVSHLTIALADGAGDIAGLEVKYNGAVLKPALLGMAMPVDGGSYEIEATAPGRKKWQAKVAMSASGDNRTLRIPLLDDAAEKAAAPPPPEPKPQPAKVAAPVEPPEPSVEPKQEPAPEPAPVPDSRSGWTGLQRVGLVTAGVGLAGVGVGTYFTFQAVSHNNDSKLGCYGDLCTPTGKQDRLDARTAGNWATVAFIGGGAVTAAGVAMVLFGGRHAAPTTAAVRAPSLEVVPVTWAGGVGGMIQGAF
jgi:hypothetical protein